jgi:hypothetical protein
MKVVAQLMTALVMGEEGTATSRKLWKEYLSFNPRMDSGETQKVTEILTKEGDRP